MAIRRPTRPKKVAEPEEVIQPIEETQPEGKIVKTIWTAMLEVLRSENFRVVVGGILLAFALYVTIAFVSFFFTGKADFSIIEQDGITRREMRTGIENITGLEGAKIVYFLVDSTFGLSSVALLFMLFAYGLKLIYFRKINGWRVLFCSAFWLIWGSMLFALCQLLIDADGFFLWGGVSGQFLTTWLVSYIQVVGEIILLIVVLFTFLIISDKNTIPNIKRFGKWFIGLFEKKEKLERLDVDVRIGEPGTLDWDDSENSTRIGDKDEFKDTNEDEGDDTDSVVINLVGDGNDSEDNITTIDLNLNSTSNEDDEPVDEGLTIKPNDGDPDNDIIEDEEDDKGGEKEDDHDGGADGGKADEDDPDELLRRLGPYNPREDLSLYKFPTTQLLKVYDNETSPVIDMEEQNANKDRIVRALLSYGIEIKSISATIGPTVTLYEIVPKEGIRVAKIKNLEDDIMMSLSAEGIRMIAPMPGKGTIGIEVPNKKPQIVSMHSVVASRKFQEEKKMRLPVVLGKTITNEIFMFDLAKTPHLLVAGATGQGKSVGLNAIITSLLYKKHPSELKLVLVDPKMVEFTIYKNLINHFMAAMPDQEDINDIIITDCKKVINTLNSLVIEMENRYRLLMDANCRNLEDYNDKFISRRLNPEKGHRFLPYIVIVIDEFGDFIMQAGKEVETPIARITQKARAVGMHMILATQRPSVNIITGVIKANIPTRIAFRTQSMIDSRTVLDTKGAEGLVGKGDLLYSAGNGATRIQCAFVDTPEVIDIVKHIQSQQSYRMPYQLPEYVPENGEDGESKAGQVDLKKLDAMFNEIAHFVVREQQGSTSVIQRKFNIGYNRAGRLTDQLEALHIVGPNNGPKGRQVLIQDEMTLEQILQEAGVK